MTALVRAEQFTRLEVLRVPYNDLKSPGVTRLVALLEAGALPALRVLDVANVVETDFVTNACTRHANQVDLESQRALVQVLAARRR